MGESYFCSINLKVLNYVNGGLLGMNALRFFVKKEKHVWSAIENNESDMAKMDVYRKHLLATQEQLELLKLRREFGDDKVCGLVK